MNQNLQESILGIILKDNDKASEIFQKVKPDYFTSDYLKDIFLTAHSIFKKTGTVDALALLQELPTQDKETRDFIAGLLKDITTTVTSDNLQPVITSMLESYTEERLQEIAMNGGTLEEKTTAINKLLNEREDSLRTIEGNDPTVKEFILNQLDKELKEEQQNKAIMTGFSEYDRITGGIYAGLYIVGAISSLGKTTFIHQVSDNIASTGRHVLYFSLEMSETELITKSFSREHAKILKDCGKSSVNALQIRKNGHTEDSIKAMKKYLEYSDNITIIQGDFDTNVHTVKNKITKYMKNHPNSPAPVIVIDYLQLLKPTAESATLGTKGLTDYNMECLKLISRDFKTPVIAISSFNRMNYDTEVSFESFKESGGIEYTADVIIGLQLGVTGRLNEIKDITSKRQVIADAKSENPKTIQMKILKNRYGKTESDNLWYEFFGHCDYFREISSYEGNRRASALIPEKPKKEPKTTSNRKKNVDLLESLL